MAAALTCQGCQKKYVWKAKYAGMRVQCPCGQVMRMPTQNPADSQASDAQLAFSLESPAAGIRHPADNPPVGQQTGDDGTFELALTEEPAPPALPPSGALAAALSAKPSAVAQALENREDEYQLSLWKERYFPAAIATAGSVAMVILWFIFATSTRQALLGSAGMLLAEALVLMPIALGAVFITARVMDIGFGPMMPALVKLAAIAIGSGGVADILFFKMMLSVDFDYQMLLVAFVLHMILLGLPMLIVFELELGEMVMIVAIIVIPRIAILYSLGAFFPHWF